jgi:hypothetical protein
VRKLVKRHSFALCKGDHPMVRCGKWKRVGSLSAILMNYSWNLNFAVNLWSTTNNPDSEVDLFTVLRMRKYLENQIYDAVRGISVESGSLFKWTNLKFRIFSKVTANFLFRAREFSKSISLFFHTHESILSQKFLIQLVWGLDNLHMINNVIGQITLGLIMGSLHQRLKLKVRSSFEILQPKSRLIHFRVIFQCKHIISPRFEQYFISVFNSLRYL